jgi:hypothetical protein
MAIRFNLRIKHVHRGILLGTGPLVDPAFEGDLLIPLHNLTATDYRISANEGLIWVEFTKTTRRTAKDTQLGALPEPVPITLPSHTSFPSVEFYFEKANGNEPIESSIPGEIKKATSTAEAARKESRAAKKTNQYFAGIGFLAVLAVLIALVNFLQSANSRIDSFSKTSAEAAAAKADLEKAIEEVRRESSIRRSQPTESDFAAILERLSNIDARLRAVEGSRENVNPPKIPSTGTRNTRGMRDNRIR